jgi:hypothetical protein
MGSAYAPLLIFGYNGTSFILELTGLLMSDIVKKKYSLGTPSLMRGLDKGQECEVKFLTDPKPVETEHGSKFDIQVQLLSHPHESYSSLPKEGRRLTWRTNCHVVRVTIMDLFNNNTEDFQKDWYDCTWTISCKEDGNIWIDA